MINIFVLPSATLLLFLFMITGCGNNQKRLQIGDQAPIFATEDINAQPVDLKKMQGNPVVIRFFVTDCKFCKADTVVFNEYYEKFKAKGLNVIYITTTTDRKVVRAFADDLKIKFPVVIDTQEKISQQYNVKAVPQAIILTPEHKILTAILGGVSEAELEELLGAYLQ